ncbi:MAG: transcription repressor NadR [Defluviitaleaceae bacterium]|nr:transcription repressor NadR [Defluviitaleaceae bacterium]
MDAASRRNTIYEIINQSNAPVSASSLAKRLNVSRQAIVGDIALLRAQGYEVIATARGYMTPEFREPNKYIGKIACSHSPENTKNELYTIVNAGAVILDVIVEHELYGEIAGQLNLRNRQDVDAFLHKVKTSEVKLLSELTMGVHLHTIACRDKAHFEQVCQALDKAGHLYKD